MCTGSFPTVYVLTRHPSLAEFWHDLNIVAVFSFLLFSLFLILSYRALKRKQSMILRVLFPTVAALCLFALFFSVIFFRHLESPCGGGRIYVSPEDLFLEIPLLSAENCVRDEFGSCERMASSRGLDYIIVRSGEFLSPWPVFCFGTCNLEQVSPTRWRFTEDSSFSGWARCEKSSSVFLFSRDSPSNEQELRVYAEMRSLFEERCVYG